MSLPMMVRRRIQNLTRRRRCARRRGGDRRRPETQIRRKSGGVRSDGLFDDFRARYSGLFAIARDLDVF